MPVGIPDYKNLELSGEARLAADGMEDRAREPSSAEMFDALVRPLLGQGVRRVLEVGCGTGALAGRIATACPGATVYALDKSPTMLMVAQSLRAEEGVSGIEFLEWDVTDEAAFPAGDAPFDLVISSVMLPYLSDEQTVDLVNRLAARLAPGGVLAFVEQDLATVSIAFPDPNLVWKAKRAPVPNESKRLIAINLRPVLRDAGLEMLPRATFPWVDDHYGPYMRRLQHRTADDLVKAGIYTAEDARAWKDGLDALAAAGDFHYGLVYHRIAAAKPR